MNVVVVDALGVHEFERFRNASPISRSVEAMRETLKNSPVATLYIFLKDPLTAIGNQQTWISTIFSPDLRHQPRKKGAFSQLLVS